MIVNNPEPQEELITDNVAFGLWSGTESEEKTPNNNIGFCDETQSLQNYITGCCAGGSGFEVR